MASEERIKNLSAYCEQWKESVDNAVERKEELASWKERGMYIFENSSNEDLFPTLIQEADNAVNIYRNILAKMEALRDRAISGEDV